MSDPVYSQEVCATCGGNGWIVETGTTYSYQCCGRFTEQQECCNDPDLVPEPEPVQVVCPVCHGAEPQRG